MAIEYTGQLITLEANGDLSASQYRLLNVLVGTVDLRVEVEDTDTLFVVGVLQNKPAAAGRAATVQINGVSRAVASTAINAGALVTPTTGGKLKPAASGDVPCGILLDSPAADDEICSLLILQGQGPVL
jgi:hypothetical protein